MAVYTTLLTGKKIHSNDKKNGAYHFKFIKYDKKKNLILGIDKRFSVYC